MQSTVSLAAVQFEAVVFSVKSPLAQYILVWRWLPKPKLGNVTLISE